MTAILYADPSYGYQPMGARIGPGYFELKRLPTAPAGPEIFPTPTTLSEVASLRLSRGALLALSDNRAFSPARGWARVIVGPWEGPVHLLGVDPRTVNYARLVPASARGAAVVRLAGETGPPVTLSVAGLGALDDLDTRFPDGPARIEVPAGTLAVLRGGRTGVSSPAVLLRGPASVTKKELGFRVLRVEYCAL
jgi:hypothetical protein